MRDTVMRGFAVDVGALGAKTFTLDYRPKGTRTKRRMTFGRFPDVTPDAARKEARTVKAEAILGYDTLHSLRDDAAARDLHQHAQAREAATVRARPTLAELADRFLADTRVRVKPGTVRLYEWLLGRRIIPAMGQLTVALIELKDIEAFHLSLSKTPTAANQCLRLVSTMLRYAERHGLRPRGTNPATDAPRFRESLKERYLQPHELQALLRALEDAATVGLPPAPQRQRPVNAATAKHAPPPKANKMNRARGSAAPANPAAIAALRLLLLTGARKSEILGLRWGDVDVSRGMMTLPDTKTGRSQRPLSPAALRILTTIPRLAGAEFIFASPASPNRPIADLSRIWCAVRHAAGLTGVRLHDLRHTAASLMLQEGASLAEVGRVVGHASSRTTQRYASISDTGARRATDLLAGAIARAGGTARPTGD